MKQGSARPAGFKKALFWPELAGEEVGPLYGIFGEEDFLVNREAALFLESPAFATNPSLNVERFLAEETKVGKILESARTIPFLGRRRLIIVKGFDHYKAKALNDFLDYLEKPVTSTCLLFCGQKLDARTKFAKTLKKAGKVRLIKKLYPRELPGFLNERAKARGKTLDHQAAARLAELGGMGLSALDSEIEKLCLYVGSLPKITLNDVLEVVGKGRLYTIFDFTDALASSDLARAISSWAQLYALGEPPIKVLAMVTRLFRQLLQVRGILDKGGTLKDVQRTLRIPPKATETLYRRAKIEDTTKLSYCLELILNADIALKSSGGENRVIMERLLMNLCHE